MQEKIIAKRVDVYAINAGRIARDAGLAGRTNTILQTCFFAISGVLPRDEAIAAIKSSIAKTYGRRGPEVVRRNNEAVDRALAGLHKIEVPGRVTSPRELPPVVPVDAPEFVRTVIAAMMAGVHPVRQLQLCLPAQRDQVDLLRRDAARRRTTSIPLGAPRRPLPARHQVHAPEEMASHGPARYPADARKGS